MVKLEFTGTTQGGITYPGLEGRRYIAGNNDLERFIDAHPDDVEKLVATGYFRVVDVPVEKKAEPKPKKSVVKRPTKKRKS